MPAQRHSLHSKVAVRSCPPAGAKSNAESLLIKQVFVFFYHSIIASIFVICNKTAFSFIIIVKGVKQ